jgi:uncharacterized UPF0160 family protein
VKYKNVYTHGGKFHPDEVFAIAVLKLLNPDIQIIRVAELPKAKEDTDAYVDIGMRYDPDNGYFDHHQVKGAPPSRTYAKVEVPRAAFGAVWLHYGEELCRKMAADLPDSDKIKAESYTEAVRAVDKSLVHGIDAADVGKWQDIPSGYVTIGAALNSFNPGWMTSEESNFSQQFYRALDAATEVLKNYAVGCVQRVLATDYILEAEAEGPGGSVLILHRYAPWQGSIGKRKDYKKLAYIAHPSRGGWALTAIPTQPMGKTLRVPFPESWRGLNGAAIAKAADDEEALFCHRSGFLLATGSKEAALRLAEKSLNQKGAWNAN